MQIYNLKIGGTTYQKDTKIIFSTLLSKTSLRFLNIKNLKELCNKLQITTHDYQYYSEVILQSLILIKDEDKMTKQQLQFYEYDRIYKNIKLIKKILTNLLS